MLAEIASYLLNMAVVRKNIQGATGLILSISHIGVWLQMEDTEWKKVKIIGILNPND